MSTFTCMDPKFDWIEERGWWSACTRCGRLAWDHEQSDPLADIRAVRAGRHDPPVMRAE